MANIVKDRLAKIVQLNIKEMINSNLFNESDYKIKKDKYERYLSGILDRKVIVSDKEFIQHLVVKGVRNE